MPNLEVYDNSTGILLARVDVMSNYTPQDFVRKMASAEVTVKNAMSKERKSQIAEGQAKAEAAASGEDKPARGKKSNARS